VSLPDRVKPGYFFRAQEPPLDIDGRYKVICVQWRTMQDPAAMDWCIARQREGALILLHVPVIYISWTSQAEPQVRIREAVEANNAWFRNAEGEVVVSDTPNPQAMIDFRHQNVVRDLVDVHCGLLVGHAPHFRLIPDGLFLDYLPDKGINWWLGKWNGVKLEEFELTSYIEDLYFFVASFRFNLAKRSGRVWTKERVSVFGNGTHRCPACDGICYENFPNSFHDGSPQRLRGLDVIRGGPYGLRENPFRLPPLIIPCGPAGSQTGDNITDDDVVQAVNFADSMCPGATVFDNGGHIFTVMEDLK